MDKIAEFLQLPENKGVRITIIVIAIMMFAGMIILFTLKKGENNNEK